MKFLFNSQLIFILILFFILYNKHFTHFLFVKLPKIIIYILNNDLKKIKYQFNYFKKYGFDKYVFKNKQVISPFKNYKIVNNIDFINNPNILEKKNSLSVLISGLTSPHHLNGNFISDSLFRINLQDRGNDNNLKKKYMSALSVDKNEIYRNMMKKYLKKTFNENLNNKKLYDFILKITIDLTYLLHFGKLPNKEEIKMTIDIINNFTLVFKDMNLFKHYKNIFNLKYKYIKIKNIINETIKSNRNCIVKFWHKNNLSIDYIYIEFIHNILGMTINWFDLLYFYLINLNNKSIEYYKKEQDINKYLFETIRFICPVKFIASSVKNQKFNLIHNIYNITRDPKLYINPKKFDINNMNNYKNNMSKCPFSHIKNNNNKNNKKFYKTEKNAIVQCGFSILENDNYINFGRGYRRCPGELLTYTLLEEFIYIVNQNKSKIKIELNKSIKKHFMFGIIETNYYFV